MARDTHSFMAVATAALFLLSSPLSVTASPAGSLFARADCKPVKVNKDDNCEKLAKTCGVSLNDFTKANPSVDCKTLEINQRLCCNSGTLPATTYPRPNVDGSCADTQVAEGDGCGTLLNKCDIPNSHFTKYNPGATFCADLVQGQWICCSSGKLRDRRPPPNADGSCATYQVKENDSCTVIEASYGMKKGELDEINKGKTWGWSGCERLWKDSVICLSKGDPPMPLPLENALCGPQKPGTIKPPKGTNISELNPCPLKACCNVWGQCGTTADFCTVAGDGHGTPGTSAPGKNSCISNCGTGITNNDKPPARFITVGYFEAWNYDRPCLRMDVTQIDENKYSHTHFSFGDITPSFEVSMKPVQKQFDRFLTLEKTKKIVAFGGWAASTSPTTFDIFRQGVNPANREKLAQNIANFAIQYKLDGIDIDWEYPAAPDLPHIPAADPIDGPNYLKFLARLRQLLPSEMSLSIAAPASYWYLKGFPIDEMAKHLDYIVYMTYDLHGQWDAGSEWASPGCKSGNCLRSHVNITETENSLAMITKAGVPANKIVVGVSSYGRSFKMADKNCWGPNCFFTGTFNHSEAKPGICTGTAGYLSNAEIKLIIETNNNVKTFIDSSRSNILIYDDTEWVAYMDDVNKAARARLYKNLNFAGTTDWAVDLDSFNPTEYDSVTSPEYSNDTPWWEVYCDNKIEVQANTTGKTRWSKSKATMAWSDAVAEWNQVSTKNMVFSDFVTNQVFKAGIHGFVCGDTLPAGPCNSQQQVCIDKKVFPNEKVGLAGKYITNSFVQIEQTFVNYRTALSEARSEVTALAPVFIDHFANVEDDTFAKQMAFNVLALLLGSTMPPVLNNMMSSLGSAGDMIVGTAEFAINSFKDYATGEEQKELSEQSQVLLYLNATLGIWERSIVETNQALFNGSSKSIERLRQLISDGKLTAGAWEGDKPPPRYNILQIKNMIKKVIFGYTVQKAWQIGNVWPAILKTGKQCGARGFSKIQLPDGVVEGGEWCDSKGGDPDTGDQYVIVVVQGKNQKCEVPYMGQSPVCTFQPFDNPPGTEHLGRYGLDLGDFVQGSLNTFRKANKNQPLFNPDNISIKDIYTDDKDVFNMQYLKFLDIGMMNIPICSIDDAWNLWQKFGSITNVPLTYPCPE